ncbi:putative cryptochrome dash [Rosellinia necatrix]|uniref:Cryptochrome DASH n=1 Tax=Rosellinia necatrix TaxID=77044 RepID=A0A1W2TU28_ROSNE|nr:putative cryptochrome dash [Rosellinia necatrix]
MPDASVLVYLVRRDLRITDNPILHQLASSTDHGFTHLLPLHIIPPNQIEVSGFLRDGETSPFPEARSETAGFWRCGPHRARFIAESLWNLKENLAKLGNDLTIRIGEPRQVLEHLAEGLQQHQIKVSAIWMFAEEGHEEERHEKSVAEACSALGIVRQVWVDEKYFVDDRDLNLGSPQELPDVFTLYRKLNEPLRERPRPTCPRPPNGSLPTPVDACQIPSQPAPFDIPLSREAFEVAMLRPVKSAVPEIATTDQMKSAHPFCGGEDNAFNRLEYLIKSGIASQYKSSRNGLLGVDYSTKLSSYLAQGCITARQIHEELLHFEDGTDEKYAATDGYGQGENEGTSSIRFELLWRDYMRLCTRKFRAKLFSRSGFRDDHSHQWKMGGADDDKGTSSGSRFPRGISALTRRVLEGTTGQSLIDASARELIHTGYTSNRARQNVGSFLAKHLNIDWRYGAEWYEFLLVDYDVNSNWSNWQYVAGVGNDPRGEARIFNPVKQAFDYDKDGAYVRCWLPELAKVEKLENLFQPWTTPREDWERFGLVGLPSVEDPVKKINFSVEGKPKSSRRPFARRRGRGRGEANNRLPPPLPPPPPPPPPSQPPLRQHPNHGTWPVPVTHPAYPASAGLMGVPHGNPRGGFQGRGGYGGPRRGGFQGGRGGWQQQQQQQQQRQQQPPPPPSAPRYGAMPFRPRPEIGPMALNE